MTIEQISVFVENAPGRLLEIMETLGNAGIDLRALSIGDTARFGVLRLIVKDPQKAVTVLRAADYVISVTPVLAVSLEDTPGSLVKILRLLSDAAITVEYLYAFAARKKNSAYVVFRVEDNALASAVLESGGVKVAGAAEIYDALS
ncbi:MAG: amino acid-binding protein [Desulfovibrio sp.]|jgi:hypothetical protein|nr:amino acid-binding protein [Desulfovibrio sp.]